MKSIFKKIMFFIFIAGPNCVWAQQTAPSPEEEHMIQVEFKLDDNSQRQALSLIAIGQSFLRLEVTALAWSNFVSAHGQVDAFPNDLTSMDLIASEVPSKQRLAIYLNDEMAIHNVTLEQAAFYLDPLVPRYRFNGKNVACDIAILKFNGFQMHDDIHTSAKLPIAPICTGAEVLSAKSCASRDHLPGAFAKVVAVCRKNNSFDSTTSRYQATAYKMMTFKDKTPAQIQHYIESHQ